LTPSRPLAPGGPPTQPAPAAEPQIAPHPAAPRTHATQPYSAPSPPATTGSFNREAAATGEACTQARLAPAQAARCFFTNAEPRAFTTGTAPERWIVSPALVLLLAGLAWHVSGLRSR